MTSTARSYLIEGEGDTPFLRMNSNNYLGMTLRSEIIEAEERAATAYGTGPGAVRFISGTWSPHVALERRLAAFHRRSAAMLYSSAYATMMGLVAPLSASVMTGAKPFLKALKVGVTITSY